MDKEEFKNLIEKSLNELLIWAEIHYGKPLPKDIVFQWGWEINKVQYDKNIPEIIADNPRVYQDEKHINPCVDLVALDITADNKTLIGCYVSNYELCEYVKRNRHGREGPFIYLVSNKFFNPEIPSEITVQKLKDLGLYKEI